MTPGARLLGAAVLAASPVLAAQEPATIPVEPPVIREIVFAGNSVTREHVMRREMVVREGDPADPERVERSRQGIQDLGLFKSVSVAQTPVDGGVRLTVTVRERWYFLPVPRADANADGQKALGLSLRWYNVAGYNHTLRGNFVQRDEARENRGTSTSYSLSYQMPFIYESPYSLGFSVGQSVTPITDFGGFTQKTDSVGFSLGRTFSIGPASQGWSGSFSTVVTRQAHEGATAPEAAGIAIAPGVGAGYRNVRDYIYSNDGVALGAELAGASPDWGSDYAFVSLTGTAERYFRVGGGNHRNFNLLGALGSYHGGAVTYSPDNGIYGLGGSSRMRGYESDSLRGDFYVYGAVEYLQPVWDDWLRGVALLEASAVAEDLHSDSRGFASVGLGLRIQVTFLVDLEIDLGLALPVDGGDVRFFASKL